MSDGDDNFICGFCLTVTSGETYPDECAHCNIGSCRECGTWLKSESKMCHGCGTFFPTIGPSFCREGSTASAYQYEGWLKLTLGPHCKHVYSVWVNQSGQHVLHRKGKKGDEVVRVMTDEEVAKLDAADATP